MTPPKKWKMMLINWLFIYPVINVIFFFVFPLVKEYNQFIKTLVITLILVPTLGVCLPILHKKCENWLRK